MSRLLLIISSLIVAAYGSGQLSIVQSPKSVVFKGSDKLESESLGDVFAASLGYSVEHSSEWKGLYIADPFNTASGVVALVVDGVDKLRIDKAAASYGLTNTGGQESLDSLLYRVRSAVDFDLTQGVDSLDQFGAIIGDIKLPSDKSSLSALKAQLYAEDRLFLKQLAAISALTDKLQTLDELPAFLTVRLSLAPLLAAHAESPSASAEALKLLSAAVEQLSVAAQKAYARNVLVAVVTLKDDTIVRSKRSITRAGDAITTDIREELNLAKNYEESYPVMFNIILWFGVIMFFTLLSISYTIGYMDPGRDSIIYRMTSTRMKKDN